MSYGSLYEPASHSASQLVSQPGFKAAFIEFKPSHSINLFNIFQQQKQKQ